MDSRFYEICLHPATMNHTQPCVYLFKKLCKRERILKLNQVLFSSLSLPVIFFFIIIKNKAEEVAFSASELKFHNFLFTGTCFRSFFE